MTTIAIDTIYSEGNVRFDENDVADLAKSIDRLGLLQPLNVAKRGDKYLLVAGHRRFAALKSLGEQEVEVTVNTFVEQDTDRISMQYAENVQRKDLSAFEKAQATLDLKDAGLNQKQIADELGLKAAQVSDMQKIARVVPKDRHSEASKLTFRALEELVSETDGDSEIAGAAIHVIVDQNASVFQAVRKASSHIKTERFYTEHDELFQLLASLNVDVLDNGPEYGDKWFPIVTTPARGGTHLSSHAFVDVDLTNHRAEPCHAAWLHSEYSGDLWLVEGCVNPGRHAKAGKSGIKVEQAAKAGSVTNEQKEKEKADRAAKQARKVEALEWVNEQKMTVADTSPYVDVAWRELLSNDMAQQFNKMMGLEKVYSNGAYSGTGTMVKYIEDKYDSPSTRLAYVAYLLHAYQYVLPYNTRKKLGL